MTEFRNNLTRQLDKYLIDEMKELNERWGLDFNHVYLCLTPYDIDKMKSSTWEEDTVGFRVPGATRGHITIDDDLNVVDVVFYKDVAFKSTSPHKIYCFKEEIQGQIELPQRFDLDGTWEE